MKENVKKNIGKYIEKYVEICSIYVKSIMGNKENKGAAFFLSTIRIRSLINANETPTDSCPELTLGQRMPCQWNSWVQRVFPILAPDFGTFYN